MKEKKIWQQNDDFWFFEKFQDPIVFYENLRKFSEWFWWNFRFPCHQQTCFLAIKHFKSIQKTQKSIVISPKKIMKTRTIEEIKFEKTHFSIVKLQLNAICLSMLGTWRIHFQIFCKCFGQFRPNSVPYCDSSNLAKIMIFGPEFDFFKVADIVREIDISVHFSK